MAYSPLIRSQNDATKSLHATCFTKQNYKEDYVNATISASTPNGVLAGSVAAIVGDYLVGPGNGTNVPVGLFTNDAAGRPFNVNPALASGKLTVAKGLPSVEVDVFETEDAYGTELEYSIGDKLYCSAEGFLTNEESVEGTVIGVVTKVPTVQSPVLGVDMRI